MNLTAVGLCYGMDINQRISQWEHMAAADPDNDMGWFSLGSAYKDADRLEDAQRALAKAIKLNPELSRAYQLRGQVLIELDQNDEAAQVLVEGYTRAAQRGDVMPQRAMGSLLEKIGRPVPQLAKTQQAASLGVNQIVDRRTGQTGTHLPDPPMRGPLGKFIFDHYSLETWREWIGMGTKVINELRLDFSIQEHQRVYEDHMLEWLGFSREEAQTHDSSDTEQAAKSA